MVFDVTLVDASAKKESNVCPHCHLILDTPMQTEEGIRLCKGCLEEIKMWVSRARELATAAVRAAPCHEPLAARVYRACVIVPTVHYCSKPGGRCNCCDVTVKEGQVWQCYILYFEDLGCCLRLCGLYCSVGGFLGQCCWCWVSFGWLWWCLW
jgi:hypothetical protein